MNTEEIDIWEALPRFAEDVKTFHEADTCSVCNSEKWLNAPFCRSCSIALQRMNMMKKLKEILESNKAATDLADCVEYLTYYDACRDYLICKRRGL